MMEHDAFDNNPYVSRQALAELHEQLYGWSLSRCGHDPTTAEELMQQAYVETLSGRARFDEKSSLKTFPFAAVQSLRSCRSPCSLSAGVYSRMNRCNIYVRQTATDPTD
jgi:hypothetical protein